MPVAQLKAKRINTWAREKKVEGGLCPGVQCVAETSYVGKG